MVTNMLTRLIKQAEDWPSGAGEALVLARLAMVAPQHHLTQEFSAVTSYGPYWSITTVVEVS
jgi:hypothetical protein